MPWVLYALRGCDVLSLVMIKSAVALGLAAELGLTAYSRFLSVTVIGGATGGLATFAFRRARGRGLPPVSSAALGAGARIALAVAFAGGLTGPPAPLLYAAGFVAACFALVVLSLFHSLATITSAGMRARMGMLTATAVGGIVAAPLAGVAVEARLGGLVLGVQVIGAAAGLAAAVRHRRVFPITATPVVASGEGLGWHRLRPIAWRVPLISGLAFSLGSLAPGMLTDSWGPRVGGVGAAMYLGGAIGAAGLLRVADRSPSSPLLARLRDHRRWFLPAALGSTLWLLLGGPVWVGLLTTLAAGVVLHLVQASYEQATAELGRADHAGPSIVVLQSLSSVAMAASLSLTPRLMDQLGRSAVVLGIAGTLGLLALRDAHARRRAAVGQQAKKASPGTTPRPS